MSWKFKPALKYGEPVRTQATIEVNFRLLDSRQATLGAMTFAPQTGVTAPVMTAVDLPPYLGPAEATLEFTVTPSGDTENYKVTSKMQPNEEKLLLESMRKWKFRPAIRDGVATSARAKVTYFANPALK